MKIKLTVKLSVRCPTCGIPIELGGDDRFMEPIFNNRWEDLKDETVYCPNTNCNTEFAVDGVEY